MLLTCKENNSSKIATVIEDFAKQLLSAHLNCFSSGLHAKEDQAGLYIFHLPFLKDFFGMVAEMTAAVLQS